jgi:hypothetical protein
VAYTLLTDRLETRALAAYTVAGIARALGAEVAVPDPDQVRVDFDTALAAEPADVAADSDQRVLLSALGLGD